MLALRLGAILAFAGSVLAVSGVPSSTSCGGKVFSNSDITRAIQSGVSRLSSGNLAGGYPHQYYQYADENITLVCGSSPWYEYPMLNGATYSGGSPGAYRAIFRSNGDFCANVFHASYSDSSFSQCKDY